MPDEDDFRRLEGKAKLVAIEADVAALRAEMVDEAKQP